MKKYLNNISMALLAVFPIISIYSSPIGLAWHQFLFLILLVVAVLWEGTNNLFRFPKYYIVFWAYSAVVYLLFEPFKVSNLIPGGVNFFIWSLMLGFFISHFEFDFFHKSYRVLFIIVGPILIVQEIMYQTIGIRITPYLPIGELITGDDIVDFSLMYSTFNRSCSVFLEPAHFAQYALPLLAIELFHSSKDKLCNVFSVFIIITLFFCQSGNGFLGMIFLVAFKTVMFLMNRQSKRKFLVFIIVVPIAVFSVQKFLASERGEYVSGRVVDIEYSEDARSFSRTFRGYLYYGELSPINKLMGSSYEDLVRIAGSEDSTYVNGVQKVLISKGLIGFILFLLVYISIMYRSNLECKMLTLLFLLISLIAATFLSTMMLTLTVVAFYFSKQNSSELSFVENS